MPKGKYRTARNVGFSSERLAPCIYRILAARAYFHGSSPRMWGTLAFGVLLQLRIRFIPTHVGNTSRLSAASARRSVHPHACGEHVRSVRGLVLEAGSSPRMWGTPQDLHPVPLGQRFIPTHVGNTSPGAARFRILAVHPHACGEHLPLAVHRVHVRGSSPRMWGTLRFSTRRLRLWRFIPTHVGNTDAGRRTSGGFPVHPHACGEHVLPRTVWVCLSGSSPRMWGTRLVPSSADNSSRFIPTHVGNTWCEKVDGNICTVHPHACGEHEKELAEKHGLTGSSPRMWGTLPRLHSSASSLRFIPTHVGNTVSRRREDVVVQRFIPTHVGNTNRSSGMHPDNAVHPHACGEHKSPSRGKPCSSGSSPRMWGTLMLWTSLMTYLRFIPTHVGNTISRSFVVKHPPVHPHACGEHTYRTELFLKKKKHLEKSTASSSIPWSDPEAGMPPIAARRTTLDVDG